MLCGHRVAGRTCRRARVVSEPLSEYQQWTCSHAGVFTDAGEGIRYVSRSRLTATALPGGGDFYRFDEDLVLFAAAHRPMRSLVRCRHQPRSCDLRKQSSGSIALPVEQEGARRPRRAAGLPPSDWLSDIQSVELLHIAPSYSCGQ
jgi:uncharacterized protein DUF6879